MGILIKLDRILDLSWLSVPRQSLSSSPPHSVLPSLNAIAVIQQNCMGETSRGLQFACS